LTPKNQATAFLEDCLVKTYIPKQGEVTRKWLVMDAEGKSMGRIAAEVAKVLRGKHKPEFTPFLECGDYVLVVNVDKMVVTGTKMTDKMYYRHSGYKGGLKQTRMSDMMLKDPTSTLDIAIRGMLPHNSLGRSLATHFRLYAGADHPHAAQNPEPYEF